MATQAATNMDSKYLAVRPGSQKALLKFAQGILTKRNQFSEILDKMDSIDVAYARYKATKAPKSDGVDPMPEASQSCDVFGDDDITPPIVVSQVDAYVAYLADVFLSGVPLFPVVTTASNRALGEQLESIIDDHASLGGYARQLLMFLRDGCKYNFCAIEAFWDSIDQFSVLNDVADESGQKIQRTAKKFTRLTRLNPRNVVWDYSLNPGDVAENGDYAGHLQVLSRLKMKRLMNKWSKERKAYNVEDAMMSSVTASDGRSTHFREDPQVSEYVSSIRNRNASPSWDAWFDGAQKSKRGPTMASDNSYELFTLYARIMPADFGIQAPQPNTPQIWKLIFCNNSHLVYADRIISAYDYLPILFGQPLEDGLGYQTQSIAEGEIPFQKAANTLFNIRFAASRRAVSDRALYIPDMIKPSDINSKVAAPKIPVKISALSNKTLEQAYHQIPFDMRGTETTLQDAMLVTQFSKDLSGINGPRMGSFQKGNKSVTEWNDTMGGSEGRTRLPALTLEHQVFSPLKSIIQLNIFQYGEDGIVTSQKTGQTLQYTIAALRNANLSFKVADGYTPKSKIASTDVILAGMQMIGNSPILQQAYGTRLPSMFAHFMSLSGAKGFEEYDPNYQAQQAQPNGLPANDPRTAQPAQPQPPAGQVPTGAALPANSQPVA